MRRRNLKEVQDLSKEQVNVGEIGGLCWVHQDNNPDGK